MKRLVTLLLAVSMIITLVSCGNQAAEMYCTNCGDSIDESAAYCSGCGTAVGGNTPPSSTKESSTTISSTTSTKETTTTTSTAIATTTTTIAKPTTTTKPTITTAKPTTTTKTKHEHSYVNYKCSGCGSTDPNYTLYQKEFKQRTTKYNDDVSQIQEKIDKCNSDLKKAQNALSVAKGELLSLSPNCPEWFMKQYLDNWQAYGNTYAATQAAKNAWTSEYNNKKTQLNNTIQIKTLEISSLQQNLSGYSSALTTLQMVYNSDIQELKDKYGIL